MRYEAKECASRSSYWSAWHVYLEPCALRMAFFGFSSGLPLLLVLGTLSFRLREAGIDLKTIGFLSWVGLIYGFKWVWAPIVDRVPIPVLTPWLGRRRAWLLLSQISLALGFCAMALIEPQQALFTLGASALFCAFASATQDIALDAYRIESADESRQAALAATYQMGYRLGMIWAGAGALALAAWFGDADLSYDPVGWCWSYLVMAASILVGAITTFLSPEPAREKDTVPQKSEKKDALFSTSWPKAELFSSFAAPFVDFFRRYGRNAILILLLIATYRISDIVMGVMANPFYSDIGFTKSEVAGITKIFGVVMTLVGAFLGGAATVRYGVMNILMCGALLSCLTNFLFAVLAGLGPNLYFLAVTVSADNLASGLSAAAFMAYLSGLTSRGYTATQYALFSSLMLLGPKFLAGFSGVFVEVLGYRGFFSGTALIGLPVFLLAWIVSRCEHRERSCSGTSL